MGTFGTDGIRGLANDSLTPELALKLGRAVVTVLREAGNARPIVMVGRDPRWSGEMLEAGLTAGITSAGGDAVLLGVIPTPGVPHLVVADDADAGVMISASHNPMPDNGLKVFGGDGFKLSDDAEARLEELIRSNGADRPLGDAIGRSREDRRGVVRYVRAIVDATDADLSGRHVVIDGANGAASRVAPEVFRSLGARVTELSCWPNGRNINDGCGSTHPEALLQAVTGLGADLGIAHDGDADRMVAATADGEEVDGDVVLAILADDRKQRDLLPSNTVVTTVMTNLGFKRAMAERDIDVAITRVGDRYVLERMRADGFMLGGEQSGHLIQLDRSRTGDGVLSAVSLMDVVARSGSSLAEHARIMQRLPQVLLNVAGVDKDRLGASDVVNDAVEAEERKLGDGGRVLVRKSGTEPIVRVMVEAPTEDEAITSAERIVDAVRRDLALAT